MAIPDFQTLMLPLLKLLGDEREHRFGDAVEAKALADEFGHSQDERGQMLPSGRDRLIRNRVGWDRTYKIVLIDGTMLAHLMVDHDLGVAVVRSYEIKRIDSDYFAEE